MKLSNIKGSRLMRLALMLIFSVHIFAPAITTAQSANLVELISVANPIEDSVGNTGSAWMADDGGRIIFLSPASLDPNYPSDHGLYARDRSTGVTQLVSVNSSGSPLDGHQLASVGISGNGRYAFFTAQCVTNITPAYYCGYPDNGTTLFRHDLVTAETITVGIDDQNNVSSANYVFSSYDGNKIAFGYTYSPNYVDVFVRDILANSSIKISNARAVGITSDGNILSYVGDNQITGGDVRAYTRDMSTSAITMLFESNPESPNGQSIISVSEDRKYIFFNSYDNWGGNNTPQKCFNEGCLYRYDVVAQQARLISSYMYGEEQVAQNYRMDYRAISKDGTKIVLAVRSGQTGIFFLNMNTGERFSIGYAQNWQIPSRLSDGQPLVSADGTKTLFSTQANNFGLTSESVCKDDGNNSFQCPNLFLTENVKNPSEIILDQDVLGPVLSEASWTANPKSINGDSTLTVSVSDDQSGVAGGEFFLCSDDPGQHQGVPFNYGEGTLSYVFSGPVLPEGTYEICFRAFDNSGNVSAIKSTTLYVGDNFDLAPPVVTGVPDRPANSNGWYSSPMTINWTSTDPAPSSGLPTIPTPTSVNQQGIHTYTSTQSCDAVNNCAVGVYEAKLDTVLPGGNFTGSQAVVRLLGRTITGSSTDSTSGVATVELSSGNVMLNSSTSNGGISINCNSDRTSCTWAAVASRLPQGTRTFTLKVTDIAGNTFTTTRQYTVI